MGGESSFTNVPVRDSSPSIRQHARQFFSRGDKKLFDMEHTTNLDRLRAAVQATGRYTEADELIISHAAHTLDLIDQAKADLEATQLIQRFSNGTSAPTPELSNLRGLLKDFRAYCDDLGLSPVARHRLGIKAKKVQAEGSVLSLRPPRQHLAGGMPDKLPF